MMEVKTALRHWFNFFYVDYFSSVATPKGAPEVGRVGPPLAASVLSEAPSKQSKLRIEVSCERA